jgi:hypothetical protein
VSGEIKYPRRPEGLSSEHYMEDKVYVH